MSDEIRIEPAEGVWVVRAAGAVIAETRAALGLVAGPAEPVIYFPPGDVAMMFLDPSGRSEDLPNRGATAFFHISAPGEHIADAGWSHSAPAAGLSALAGYVAFDATRVAVERF